MKSPSLILPICLALLATFVIGCVESSTNPVTFDQVIESTRFENYLLAPVILYRDNVVLDTLEPRSSRTYRIDRKGIVRHRWQLLAPRDNSGRPYGIQDGVDLGIQYAINGAYSITNVVNNRTIFTPRIANLSFRDYSLLYVNYQTYDQFRVELYLPPNSTTSVDFAPYYYWNEESNIGLLSESGQSYLITRRDTTSNGQPLLRLSTELQFQNTGATEPIVITF